MYSTCRLAIMNWMIPRIEPTGWNERGAFHVPHEGGIPRRGIRGMGGPRGTGMDGFNVSGAVDSKFENTQEVMSRLSWEERMRKESEYAGKYGTLLFAKAAPFLVHAGASSLAYSTSLAMVQVAGILLRISCATPVIGPCLGAAGVATASVVAGHTSRKVQQWWQKGTNPFHKDFFMDLKKEDAIVDAFLGMGLFKLLGGSFRSTLPSDLRFPGALAKESLPARGSEYASEIQRAELRLLHKRHGCHHCGRKRGPTIADHMPPNKIAHGGVEGLPKRKLLWWTLPKKKIKQRFYPECVRCSQKQAECMRSNTKKLVLHFGGLQPFYLSGILVGLRQGFEVDMSDAAVRRYVSPLIYIAFEQNHSLKKDPSSFQRELDSLRSKREYLELHKVAVKENRQNT